MLTEEDYLEEQCDEAHRNLLWDYQTALASVATFLKPDIMRDVLGTLKLSNDRLSAPVENDYKENGTDIDAEMVSLRRMVRGCMALVAHDLGVILHPTDLRLLTTDLRRY
jgi:hypothetical protein